MRITQAHTHTHRCSWWRCSAPKRMQQKMLITQAIIIATDATSTANKNNKNNKTTKKKRQRQQQQQKRSVAIALAANLISLRRVGGIWGVSETWAAVAATKAAPGLLHVAPAAGSRQSVANASCREILYGFGIDGIAGGAGWLQGSFCCCS